MSGSSKGNTYMANAHDETTKTMTEARTDPPKAAPAAGPPKPAEASRHRTAGENGCCGGAWPDWRSEDIYLKPAVETALNTVSTDDAYVNGHVTFVAPRVSGQVSQVLVDDNYRVKKGDVLVQLDKEPYQVQVEIKKAAVTAAEADLVAAKAQVRGLVAQARANRFQLEHAIEDVNTQIADLAPTWRSSRAGRRPWSWPGPT